MFTKEIDLSDRSFVDSQEQVVSPLVFSKNHGFEINDRLSKTAACDEALQFASQIQPIPGARVVLVSAMGTMDAWGANKKGDMFTEEGLLGKLPSDVPADFFKNRILPPEWGISLFPTKFNELGEQIGGGNSFREHNNRPPKVLVTQGVYKYNPRGTDQRIGDILAAFFNPAMYRVELIQTFWECNARDICDAIDQGFLPGISMACDVPFDRCSICGNLAATPTQYCSDLHPFYGNRGKIHSNGKVIGMINDIPLLFDSSAVKVRAATEAGTLAKIASNEAYSFRSTSICKPVEKELVKVPFADIVNASKMVTDNDNQMAIPSYALRHVASTVGFSKSAAILGALGVNLTPRETFQMIESSNPSDNTASLASSLYGKVLTQKVDLGLSRQHVNVIEKTAADITDADISIVIETVAPWLSCRSAWGSAREGDTKTASTLIDLNQPLGLLPDSVKSLLITKVMADTAMLAHIHNLLVRPILVWELQRRFGAEALTNVSKDNTAHSVGALPNLLSSYNKALPEGRDKFYSEHPDTVKLN
jgi:hypothetical protein